MTTMSRCRQTASALALALLVTLPADAATYTIDSAESELAVRTFRSGLASAFAHDHVARAARFSGSIEYDTDSPGAASVEVTAEAASVLVDEPELRERYAVGKPVSEKDRAKIQETMEGSKQLDVQSFSEISFRSTRVQAGAEGGLQVTGDFTLHGVTRQVRFPVSVELEGETLRATGSFRVLQSDHGIEPFSGGMGTVRNQDEVELIIRLHAKVASATDPD